MTAAHAPRAAPITAVDIDLGDRRRVPRSHALTPYPLGGRPLPTDVTVDATADVSADVTDATVESTVYLDGLTSRADVVYPTGEARAVERVEGGELATAEDGVPAGLPSVVPAQWPTSLRTRPLGWFRRVYTRVVALLKRIPPLFGIRDERGDD